MYIKLSRKNYFDNMQTIYKYIKDLGKKGRIGVNKLKNIRKAS